MQKKRVGIFIGMIVLALAGWLLSRDAFFLKMPTRSAGKISVSASVYPVYFLATRIGGDFAEVTSVVPSGAEPHDFEPTPRDMARIADARLVLLVGAGLEPWGDAVSQSVDMSKATVVRVGEDIATKTMEEEGVAVRDPHVWLSPVLMERMADAVEAEFARVDPEHATQYAGNTQTLKNELRQLDDEYRAGLAHCKTRDIVTAHAAFGYLAVQYELSQLPIAGLSPDAEPSTRQLADLATLVKARDVGVIFFETLASPKLAQALARETGTQAMELNPLEGLTETERARGEDYFSRMRENLNHLQTALQCTL